jgi:hypothetical protein
MRIDTSTCLFWKPFTYGVFRRGITESDSCARPATVRNKMGKYTRRDSNYFKPNKCVTQSGKFKFVDLFR